MLLVLVSSKSTSSCSEGCIAAKVMARADGATILISGSFAHASGERARGSISVTFRASVARRANNTTIAFCSMELVTGIRTKGFLCEWHAGASLMLVVFMSS
jgi:hypothetical protein